MDIENGTEDNAKVRVSGGGPGQIPKDGCEDDCEIEREWHLAPKQKLSLPDFDPGCIIKISVEKEVGRHEVKPTARTTPVKGLRLTKTSRGGYTFKPTRNGTGPTKA